MAGRALVTGATGFIGGRLASELAQAGWDVRAMVCDRDGARSRELERGGLELHEGDVLRPESLRGAGEGVDVASMVVGAQSESYRTLRYLVQRLPAMIAPAWLRNAMQPIAIDDTLRYLVDAPSVAASTGREIQIGGPDVLSYGEMLDRMAAVLGLRRRPRVPVPLITPWLSSLWIGLVTPVDAVVARPLVEGLAVPTVVTDPSGAELFDVRPLGFDAALRLAVEDDPEVRARS